MVALRSVCIGKILLHGLGYRYEDITEGEPVHDVEKNKRAGKHYSRHTVLKNRMVGMMTMIVILIIYTYGSSNLLIFLSNFVILNVI